MNRLIFLLIILSVFLTGCNMDSSIDKPLNITVFGFIDADSTLITNGETNIIIDAGEKEHGSIIVEELKAQGIEEIDCLILSHPDKDHIGGAADIIKNIKVKQIIQSNLQKDTKLQNELNKMIQEYNINTINATKTEIYNFGDIRIKIFSPSKLSYNKSNNYSLIAYMEYAERKLLFAGDSENKRLKEAMNYNIRDMDFYKVAHHGRANNLSGSFIEKIRPKIAVITSDHGDDEIIKALEDSNAHILFTSNGNINFRIDPSNDNGIEIINEKDFLPSPK